MLIRPVRPGRAEPPPIIIGSFSFYPFSSFYFAYFSPKYITTQRLNCLRAPFPVNSPFIRCTFYGEHDTFTGHSHSRAATCPSCHKALRTIYLFHLENFFCRLLFTAWRAKLITTISLCMDGVLLLRRHRRRHLNCCQRSWLRAWRSGSTRIIPRSGTGADGSTSYQAGEARNNIWRCDSSSSSSPNLAAAFLHLPMSHSLSPPLIPSAQKEKTLIDCTVAVENSWKSHNELQTSSVFCPRKPLFMCPRTHMNHCR